MKFIDRDDIDASFWKFSKDVVEIAAVVIFMPEGNKVGDLLPIIRNSMFTLISVAGPLE